MRGRIVFLCRFLFFGAALIAQDAIDVSEQGISDGVRNSKQQDRDEAILDAKLKAIEKAGVDIKSVTTVVDFQLKKDWVESKAQACLLPGFQIVEMGYGADGLYHVVLVGKISRSGTEGESEGDQKYRYAKRIMEQDNDRGIKLMEEIVDQYPKCASADDALWAIIQQEYFSRRLESAKENFIKLQAYYPSSPYINSFQNLEKERKENDEKNREEIRQNMIFIPGSTFQMGDTFGDNAPYEKPVHPVAVSDFYMGKTEVTVAQYRTFCSATGRSMPSAPSWAWQDDHPMVDASWNDAKAFCEWAGCRLPTEAEWEYAAKGGNQGKGYKYSGSNTIDDVAWYFNNSGSQTHAVGTKAANELGLFDMSGNAWEWCSDWFDEGYYGKSLNSNPQGPDSGLGRLLRGGFWYGIPWYCRVTYRRRSDPNNRTDDVGFRCARSVNP